MKIEKLRYDEALQRGVELPFALIRSLSHVALGTASYDVDEQELIEARFFREDCEIRVFRRDGHLEGVMLQQEANDAWLEESYRVENPKLGEQITVRYDLSTDEDGQTYVASSRLAGWKGGGVNG